MSKIAFISDIHGNYSALQSVLDDCKNRGVERIYCLGDLVGYYSQVNEVIDIIREVGIVCVMGNHDYAMAYKKGVIERSKTCTNILIKQLTYISLDNFCFLQSLPDQMVIESGCNRILCVHGGLHNHIDEYLDTLNDDYFSGLPSDITHVVTAHNHKASIADFKTVHYANCGSIGQPRDHDSRASYVILENSIFSIVRVEYDINNTFNKMKENGFPEYIAKVLYKGFRIGE